MVQKNTQETEAPGWLDFMQYYQKLSDLKKCGSHDTRRMVAYVKHCHDYMESLTAYEYQYVYSIPSFAYRFDRVNNMYRKIENIIKETVEAIVSGRKPD